MKFVCEKCGEKKELEAPQHCGGPCEVKEGKFTCPKCGYSEDVPQHCGGPMKKEE